MKKATILLLIIFIFLSVSCSQKEVPFDSLVERNELMYEVNNNTPYSGKVFRKFNNGQFMMTGIFNKGQKNGEWLSYYNNGQIKKKENYESNQLNGLYETFTESGTELVKTNYLNGNYDGNYKEYNNSSILLKDINYKKGAYNGDYNIYNSKGILIIKTNYKNGVRDGKYLGYYDNGNIRTMYSLTSKGYYDDSIDYNLDGTVSEHKFFKNGDKINKGVWKKYWNNDWEKVSEPSVYYSLISFDDEGNPNGKVKYFYQDNNSLKSEQSFKSINPDIKEGESVYYSKNGDVLMRGEYKNNKKEGVWETYYITNNYDGTKIKERCHYKNGVLQGEYIKWMGGEESENSLKIVSYSPQTKYGYWKMTGNVKDGKLDGVFKIWAIYKTNFYDKENCYYKMNYYTVSNFNNGRPKSTRIGGVYTNDNSYINQNNGLYFDNNDNRIIGLEYRGKRNQIPNTKELYCK